jgi:hypothetical protein
MNGYLVVVRPFADYVPGDVVGNPARIAAVLEGEHAHSTVLVAAPAKPAPQHPEV